MYAWCTLCQLRLHPGFGARGGFQAPIRGSAGIMHNWLWGTTPPVWLIPKSNPLSGVKSSDISPLCFPYQTPFPNKVRKIEIKHEKYMQRVTVSQTAKAAR